jgi:hypothetical protein
MTKARNLADNALTTVSPTELGYVDGVTSSIQTQLDAKIAKTLTSTTGDIIYASSANTPARLGIGSTGQLLTVAGGVPTWAAAPAAGSMTLLSTTTLSGGTTTISSIDQTYNNLFIVVDGYNGSSNLGDIGILVNNASTVNYAAVYNSTSTGAITSSNIYLTWGTVGASSTNRNAMIIISNYASTTQQKAFTNNGWNRTAGFTQFGNIATTSAITSLVFSSFGTGTLSAGTVLLYGVK